jgi:hypothetical protein
MGDPRLPLIRGRRVGERAPEAMRGFSFGGTKAGQVGSMTVINRCFYWIRRRNRFALIRRLQIVWPKGTRRLSVALLPDCDDDDLALPVTSLDEWLARRPVRLASYPRRASRINAARHAAGDASTGFAPFQARVVRKPGPEREQLFGNGSERRVG